MQAETKCLLLPQAVVFLNVGVSDEFVVVRILGMVVRARGFELPAREFAHDYRRSLVPHKQKIPFDFPPSTNPTEHRQTSSNPEQLLLRARVRAVDANPVVAQNVGSRL